MPPLPSSPNSISLGQIRNEFGTGSSGGIRIGQYRTAYDAGGIDSLPFDTGIPIGNVSIKFSNFYGKRLNTVQVIDGNGSTTYRYIINPNNQIAVGGLRNVNRQVRSTAKNIVYVYDYTIGSIRSQDRRVSALRTNTISAWYGENDYSTNGASIVLNINSSDIYGTGGKGGKSGDEDTDGENGENGTSALGLQVPITNIFLKSSNLFAGGGGGGGGGGSKETSGGNNRRATGGGGGGGAGLPVGKGGSGVSQSNSNVEYGGDGADGTTSTGGDGGRGSNNDGECTGGSGGGGGPGISGGAAGDTVSNSGKTSDVGGPGEPTKGGNGGDGIAYGTSGKEDSDGGEGGSNGFSIVSNSGISIPTPVLIESSNFAGGTGAGQGVA